MDRRASRAASTSRGCRTSAEQLLTGRFQICKCPWCGAATTFESTVVYTDFERHEYVACETAACASWQAAILPPPDPVPRLLRAWPADRAGDGQGVQAPARLRLHAPREKIVLWDARLDDRIVEAVKGDLLAATGEARRGSCCGSRACSITRNLLFARPRSAPRARRRPRPALLVMALPPARDFATAPAAMYQARAAAPSRVTRDYLWLGDDWFVDIHDGPSYLYT